MLTTASRRSTWPTVVASFVWACLSAGRRFGGNAVAEAGADRWLADDGIYTLAGGYISVFAADVGRPRHLGRPGGHRGRHPPAAARSSSGSTPLPWHPRSPPSATPAAASCEGRHQQPDLGFFELPLPRNGTLRSGWTFSAFFIRFSTVSQTSSANFGVVWPLGRPHRPAGGKLLW
jgi:hypothetical protein